MGWLAERTFLAGKQLVQGASWRWGRPGVSGKGRSGWWSLVGLCVAGGGLGSGQARGQAGARRTSKCCVECMGLLSKGRRCVLTLRWFFSKDHSSRVGSKDRKACLWSQGCQEGGEKQTGSVLVGPLDLSPLLPYSQNLPLLSSLWPPRINGNIF